ncbi:MAG TPA: hypothetical protein VFX28_23415 [Methylomirabilota bacterium]|nr:hypothetical protein [Methylomirabilota bacterium]
MKISRNPMPATTLSPAFLARYRRAYNTLPDVDDAYARLRDRRDHMTVIRAALRIIKDHGANDFLGVSLLHRHFRCEAGAVFIERTYTPRAAGHRTLLVTAPTPATRAPRGITPYRLHVDPGGKLQPLEYTTDRVVTGGYARLVEGAELRRDLGRHLARSRLASSLGVGIFPRSGALAGAPHVFIEETDFEKRASVTHVRRRLPRGVGRLIPTVWTVGETGSGCCLPQGVCVAYCTNHEGTGGYCGHKKSSNDHLGCV